jgi:Tol biopolymer transport system component
MSPTHPAKVYLLPAEGGTPEPIDGRDLDQGIPSWSEDGRRLTFGDVPETYGVPTGSERIHVYDVRSKTLSDLPDSASLWSSRWSPDGRYILALTIDERELRIFDVRDGVWRRLPARHADHPSWSPDSRFVYLDPEGPEKSLRRVDVLNGRVEEVLDLKDYGVLWAGVAPDGTPLVLRITSDVVSIKLNRW